MSFPSMLRGVDSFIKWLLSFFGARKATIVFHRIWFAENLETGRSGYGETRQEAIDYVNSDDAYLSRAWKCHYRDYPEILAFGQTKQEASSRLIKHIAGASL